MSDARVTVTFTSDSSQLLNFAATSEHGLERSPDEVQQKGGGEEQLSYRTQLGAGDAQAGTLALGRTMIKHYLSARSGPRKHVSGGSFHPILFRLLVTTNPLKCLEQRLNQETTSESVICPRQPMPTRRIIKERKSTMCSLPESFFC